ncbi:MAG TPA: glycosyltransferase family 4 protein [Patescibacteria group bacterium]|nr:glycosyltransferase family 4 protein [Patescibacteria group bacterium]
MKILLLNWRDPINPRSGGAEYVTLGHAKAWVKKGDQVTWLAASFEGGKSQEVIDDITFVRSGNAFTIFLFAVFYYLKHKNDIDIIVDETHGIPFFTPLYARKPIVLFIHEIAGGIWPVMYGPFMGWLGRLLERLYVYVYRKQIIWTDAPSMVDELVSLGVSRNRCVAIACPIANRSLQTRPEKNNSPTFIFVGRIVRMKRVEDVLQAFSIIRTSRDDSGLWIVGTGDSGYSAKLAERAQNLGISDSVTWFGHVSDKKKLELLRASHILLHASVKEGWGLVVLEAASQWTPSVVYKVAGLVDTVRDGRTGIVVSSCTPKDLATQALTLLSDTKRYQRMQQLAAEFSDSFRWEDATRESRKLIQHVYESRS